MNKLYTQWLWSNAVPIQTAPRKTYLGRMMLVAVIVCAVHAIVWSV